MYKGKNMAEEIQSAKSAFIEKLLFALLPLIIAGFVVPAK